MNFSLRMAWAYYRKSFSSNILGLMIIIAIMGVALGVASLVVTLSVMNGFQTEITGRLLTLNPHIALIDPFETEATDAELMDTLSKIDTVKSYNRFIFSKGLLHFNGSSQGVIIKGIDSKTAPFNLIRGSWKPASGNITIGSEVARIISADVGDSIYLVVPDIESIGAPLIPIVKKLKVTGIFDSGIYEYDSALSFIDINSAGRIFSEKNTARGYEIYIDDAFKVDSVRDIIREKLPSVIVQTWKEKNSNLFAALKLEKIMMFIILTMIVLVATFNIASALIMLSMSRAKDCAVLRSLGATKKQISLMFNAKGLMIGMSGTLAGLLGGLVISFILEKYKFITLPPRVYLISTLPVNVDPADIILVVLTSLTICFAASFYPSLRASKVAIAEELRNE